MTALRTGAAAALAETLEKRDGRAAVVGVGVNGRAAARTLEAVGRKEVDLWDVDEDRARAVAAAVGAGVADSLDEALAADVVVTVTPGSESSSRRARSDPASTSA